MKTPGNEQSTKGIMMSGDSPIPHDKLLYELGDSRKPKCFQDKGVQIDLAIPEVEETPAHHIVDIQKLNHTPPVQHQPPLSRPASNRRSLGNEEAIEKADDVIPSSSSSSPQVQTIPLDAVDGGIAPRTGTMDAKLQVEEDPFPDDSCMVQCLYYVIQCCECTIL